MSVIAQFNLPGNLNEFIRGIRYSEAVADDAGESGRLSLNDEIKNLIEFDGIDHATTKFADVLSEMLITEEVAYQFVLEEIEAASQGNEAARKFASSSGIEPWEYEGAMRNSHPIIDSKDGPQQLLLSTCMQLGSDIELMVEFRTTVVDKIMRKFRLGIYSDSHDKLDSDRSRLVDLVAKNENSIHGIFVNINNDLGDFIEANEDCDDLLKMAYAYARRTAAAGMFIQGVIDREVYDYVSQNFKNFQLATDHTVEFQESACRQAEELIESYTDLFDKESLGVLVTLVERGLDNSFLNGQPQDFMKTVNLIEVLKQRVLTKT
jgi:hypothetical protein